MAEKHFVNVQHECVVTAKSELTHCRFMETLLTELKMLGEQ